MEFSEILFESVLLAQSCLTLGSPMDCSSPDSSAREILQASILELVAVYCLRYSTNGRPKPQNRSSVSPYTALVQGVSRGTGRMWCSAWNQIKYRASKRVKQDFFSRVDGTFTDVKCRVPLKNPTKHSRKKKKKAHSIHLPQYKSRNNTSQLILWGQDYSTINQTKALQGKKGREKYPSLPTDKILKKKYSIPIVNLTFFLNKK